MRVKQLDILRAAAILLVLGSHAPAGIEQLPEPAQTFFRLWQKAGWAGVDLFFVLSGFLVSGLLFRDHRRTQSVDVKRFLVRRGLKIYPAFYVLFAVTLVMRWANTQPTGRWATLSEALFLQNYHVPLWGHTWSLAVEEHFYILLALVVGYLVTVRHSLRPLEVLFVVVPIIVLGLRVITALALPFQHWTHHWPTHLRIDSLLCGVFLSYLYYFSPERFATLLRWRVALLVLGMVCVAPPFVVGAAHPFMHTVGYTFLYLGCAAILLFFLGQRESSFRWARALGWVLAYIGMHSYSIYLWHVPLEAWCMPLVAEVCGQSFVLTFLVYLIGSCAVGIMMAKVVELPVLRLRDRLFPARNTERREFSPEALRATAEVVKQMA